MLKWHWSTPWPSPRHPKLHVHSSIVSASHLCQKYVALILISQERPRPCKWQTLVQRQHIMDQDSRCKTFSSNLADHWKPPQRSSKPLPLVLRLSRNWWYMIQPAEHREYTSCLSWSFSCEDSLWLAWGGLSGWGSMCRMHGSWDCWFLEFTAAQVLHYDYIMGLALHLFNFDNKNMR